MLEAVFNCSDLHITVKCNVWSKHAAGYSLSLDVSAAGSIDFEGIIYSLADFPTAKSDSQWLLCNLGVRPISSQKAFLISPGKKNTVITLKGVLDSF